jgi:hypothetical protein
MFALIPIGEAWASDYTQANNVETKVTHEPHFLTPHIPNNRPADTKRPPGNRAAFSLGRIVPTEAKPSELSGCILSLAKTRVKAKT